MKILRSVNECRNFLKSSQVGFVPTMGALHAGHLSLVERARKENDLVVVSIFVNPTQFDNQEDLAKYPNTLAEDQEKLRSAGVDALFLPVFDELYADHYRYKILENELSHSLCGASRPGHFEGVLTVVMKLFQIVRPAQVYFGEKDWQQAELIRGMVDAFFVPVKMHVCPTLREADGLAMSSRNLRLGLNERNLAPNFYRVLSSAQSMTEARKELEGLGFRVDYLEELPGRRLGAVFLGEVRLIDNVRI